MEFRRNFGSNVTTKPANLLGLHRLADGASAASTWSYNIDARGSVSYGWKWADLLTVE